MNLKHVISTNQFLDRSILGELFDLADEMANGWTRTDLKWKVLSCVFYEPSTRTRFSFESAMHKLGGNVITTESASNFSSVTKGETLEDTIKIMGGYSDVIVLRHYEKGAAEAASKVSSVPIINAGDGVGEHPTQALLDLYTIRKELGKIDGISIAFVGDLLYGRTVHSLVNLLSIFKGVKVYLVSPNNLKLPEEYKQLLKVKDIEIVESESMDGIVDEVDVLYVTRIQKERFLDQEEYESMKSFYIVDRNILNKMKNDSIILHPLPRVNEISLDIDDDKRSAYFRQANNGLYIRMALLYAILKK